MLVLHHFTSKGTRDQLVAKSESDNPDKGVFENEVL